MHDFFYFEKFFLNLHHLISLGWVLPLFQESIHIWVSYFTVQISDCIFVNTWVRRKEISEVEYDITQKNKCSLFLIFVVCNCGRWDSICCCITITFGCIIFERTSWFVTWRNTPIMNQMIRMKFQKNIGKFIGKKYTYPAINLLLKFICCLAIPLWYHLYNSKKHKLELESIIWNW